MEPRTLFDDNLRKWKRPDAQRTIHHGNWINVVPVKQIDSQAHIERTNPFFVHGCVGIYEVSLENNRPNMSPVPFENGYLYDGGLTIMQYSNNVGQYHIPGSQCVLNGRIWTVVPEKIEFSELLFVKDHSKAENIESLIQGYRDQRKQH